MSVGHYLRAVDYLGAAQLYLRENVLLRRPLRAEHIKPRLIGHWGTQPGLNLIYAHLNVLIQRSNTRVLLVVGPGHGAPAILANLYLEGSLLARHPELSLDEAGATAFVRRFSWPGGAASHLTPATPGAIHEGGELGYALLHAMGAAFDRPDLLVACVVGDGEAETGPAAASWPLVRLLDPATCGAVLPILHLNGYKLSAPTFLGRMDDRELIELFEGHGYAVHVVAGRSHDELEEPMRAALAAAYEETLAIRARAGDSGAARWPLIVLRTPKGMGCPAFLDGKALEDTFRAHQVPIEDPAGNPQHLAILEQWLRSYHPEELFDENGAPVDAVLEVVPRPDRRMGMSPYADGGALLRPLALPLLDDYAAALERRGGESADALRRLGPYLRDVFAANADSANFRLFSPDETISNHVDAVFEVTGRAWTAPQRPSDEFLAIDGRVMEVLSEHACQGWLEGYLLTGRHGLFVCYEAFATIVDSMVNQYAKWLKTAGEIPWRTPPASLNYLLTSHVWRQDHNGYSHQGPGFINALLTKKSSVVRIYLPADANTLLCVVDRCLRSRNRVNLIIAGKQEEPQWLSLEEAREHCARGASAWEWASNDGGAPDVVLAAAGDVPTQEVLAAAWLLQRDFPELRLRVVNVVDLLTLDPDHPHGLDDSAFERLFARDAPVVFAFHGFPRVIHELIYRRFDPERFHVRGYMEEGTTTTPFDMVVRNGLSRFQIASEALRRAGRLRSRAGALIGAYSARLAEHRAYIEEHGEDLPEITQWRWS
ncbi:phosphoketolase family protein [bacterium]|nr:MAG: phosphoketolase family protein [bacterium]